MDYSYIDYYGNINYEVKNNAPKASINAGDHPIGTYIASELTTITDDIQKIVHELAHCGEDEVVTKFKENVNKIYKDLTNINESFKSDYTNAENIYKELDTSLTTLKNATDDLEKLCNNKPSKPIQGDKTDEEYETIKSKWRKNIENWGNNITKLKRFCEELTVQIKTYIKYLTSINGLNAIDGKSALSMPNTGALDLNYRKFLETIDTSYDFNPNDGKRVYTSDELEHVRSWDQSYLDKYHNYGQWTLNYLETLIVSEHSDRSFAALEHAYKNGYITEEQYNYLKNPNNYNELISKVGERRALNFDINPVEVPNDLEQQESKLNEIYPETRFVNTNNSSLRLRQLPNSDSNILAYLPKGTAINVGEKTEDGWRAAYAVVDNQIVEGWVSDEYISDNNPYASGNLRDFDPTGDEYQSMIVGEKAAMNALSDNQMV